MSKAGKTTGQDVGSQHPSPERIPHSIPQNLKKGDGAVIHSPAKESNLVHQADDSGEETTGGAASKHTTGTQQ